MNRRSLAFGTMAMIRPRLIVAIAVLLSASACSSSRGDSNSGSGEPAQDGNRHGTFQHGGAARDYWVHLPPDHASGKPCPVVFVLHGGGGQADRLNQNCTDGTLERAADRLGVVLVYPQGIGKRWQDGRAFVREQTKDDLGIEPPDDVDFIVALLDELGKTLKVDRKAVFATGISNGGLMSYRLALERPDVFAAIAPVAANLPRELAGKAPSRPVSVVLFNGTEDPMMPYRGGGITLGKRDRKARGDVLSADDTMAFFSKASDCQKKDPERLQDMDPSDGTRVAHAVHEKGREGSSVELYSIEGGGHTWPGGNPYAGERMIGRVCRDIDASRIMLEFFLAHRRP